MMTNRGSRRAQWLALIFLVIAVTAPVSDLDAQYFGRNKVVYREFDFRILRTPHYDVHYYPEEAQATRDAARMADRWYVRHRATFGDTVGRRSIILYASPAEFQQTNVVGGEIGEGTGGVTEGYRSRVTLPLTGVYSETDHVMGHELVHVFQYSAAMNRPGGLQSTAALPLWLVEGMAEYISLGRADPQTAMWMRSAVLRDEVPKYKQLTDPRIFPYRYGQALCAYIGGRYGDEQLIRLYQEALRMSLETAIHRVLGVTPDQLVAEWTTAMQTLYRPAMAGRTDPRTLGTPILAERSKEAGLDVAPVVSPDGRFVAFFSSRGLFSIDIFIADVESGRIVKRLTSSTGGSHYDALSFVYNAGAWSPDARQFAFVTFANGRNELAIVNVDQAEIVKRLAVRGVGAITNPTWSPDGGRIAFSGQAGGVSDLYVYDIAAGSVTRLTNDAYADLQPAWSPDGSSMAFVTDRGPGTDLGALTYGPLGVATIDLQTKRITRLSLFAGDNTLNPQWTPDSRALYFLSAPDGFQDIYRVDLASGAVSRVTRTATGISGIAALSPALSVATKTGRVFFSVFDRTGYRMAALDASQATGEPLPAFAESRLTAGMLPPVEAARTSMIEARVHDAQQGLVDGSAYEERPYQAKLKLDAVSPVSVGVATSTFGTGLAGGVSVAFSDELGNKNLGVAVQAMGEVRDIGGQAYYVDLKHRWQRFATAGHIPYLAVFSTVSQEPVRIPGGGTVDALVVNQYLQRTYFDQAEVGTSYPFSTTQRLEFSGGVSRVSFNTQVQRLAVLNNVVYDLGRADTTSPGALSFAQAAAAFVHDNSVFGFTSPVAGGRSRFEVSPIVGTLRFTSLTGDARRYFFARPFTFAIRALSAARLGRDAETDRITPLYVGDGSLVRGYSVFSFDPAECTSGVAGGSQCPEFDRLVGSRVGVTNLEFRIPLFGTPQLGLLTTRFLPIEVAPFVDAGVAWTSTSSPTLAFKRETTDRVPIVSTGVSARFNVLGALVLEVFYAKPFQRPTKNWVWGLQLLPGW